MTTIDLGKIRERLIELRAELESVAATGDDSASVVELDQSKVGRLSRMDELHNQSILKANRTVTQNRLRVNRPCKNIGRI